MGKGSKTPLTKTPPELLCSSYSKKYSQAALDLQYCISFNFTKWLPNLLFHYRHGFVHHHLGRLVEPVGLVWLNCYAEERRIDNCTRHRQYRYSCVLIKTIRLENQRWPWLTFCRHFDG